MASEEHLTSDSLDATETDVPEKLQVHIRAKIVEYITQEKKVSMKIQRMYGHQPKLLIIFGPTHHTRAHSHLLGETNEETTRTILVRNIPASVDKDLLEIFFEAKKKCGGGPVESVKILEDRNAALIKFCEDGAVETVLKKKPIKYGKTELCVEPFRRLLTGEEAITQVDIKGISQEFTDYVVKKYLDGLAPSTGPDIVAKLKIDSKVVRGQDWIYKNNDKGGEGTVTAIPQDLTKEKVAVAWDCGYKGVYRMGMQSCYDLQLAPA